jgi:hypothetical protein
MQKEEGIHSLMGWVLNDSILYTKIGLHMTYTDISNLRLSHAAYDVKVARI